ncbi:hypothetical protein ADK87_24000 [Streptomyces sp. NRRL F-4711]|nr:hypothetical protein ADK87_24000 [Streptomyces sp. NRRL F-4711]
MSDRLVGVAHHGARGSGGAGAGGSAGVTGPAPGPRATVPDAEAKRSSRESGAAVGPVSSVESS